ncbi:SDR family oxidoreductase [Altererythrobacter sp. H2]|uniref:SDR family oxidoreductase n=1 Tax=Altererythrobacter sp. H2 TaxID=3108391 RepID=UPI002B4BC22A|nr:SDR family oxidoreductase [Altererythrobacter sp. H2]WRK95064.1 SDR family oxidoreductase [Altererythrobacter sp. H2]
MPRPSVLITGAARRLGATVARAFGESGWHVVLHYGNSAREAEALAASLPSAEAIHCDLADSLASSQMVERLALRLNDWRVLVNCAAIFRPDDVTALDSNTYDRSMAINAKTPVRMAQAFLRLARSKQGRTVIQFTDQKLENTNPDFFSYTLSKHAVAGALPMLAMGAGWPEDRIYGLAPGAILASHDQTEEEVEISHRLNLLQRKTGADEIADACLFLAQGHLASGETLFIDSGQHLMRQPRDVIYLAREHME